MKILRQCLELGYFFYNLRSNSSSSYDTDSDLFLFDTINDKRKSKKKCVAVRRLYCCKFRREIAIHFYIV